MDDSDDAPLYGILAAYIAIGLLWFTARTIAGMLA
jgi:hypothetical protein